MNIKDRIRDEKFDILSLDFFDTLIFRDVKRPKQVFDIVSICYEKECGTYLENFTEDRSGAECKARDFLKHEVTLSDIYSFLPDSYSEIIKIRLAELEKKCRKTYLYAQSRDFGYP